MAAAKVKRSSPIEALDRVIRAAPEIARDAMIAFPPSRRGGARRPDDAVARKAIMDVGEFYGRLGHLLWLHGSAIGRKRR
jgi:hypothetical protein